MTADLKVLVIGGYGVFGGRVIALLEDEPRLTLVVGGRSAAEAAAFVVSRPTAAARLLSAAFDRNGDVVQQLSAIAPDIVVDASGPFQAYGDGRYRVVEACLTSRINYLDLADGSDFVAGIDTFDQRAKAAGVFILSGVSSFPVLTAAAVSRLSAGMATVTAIRGGIAPSPYAVVGNNVIRAIAGYAGQPITRRRGAAFGVAYPFTEHSRYTIATPGYVPLRSTLFSLVDVPDLRALAKLWPAAAEIWMGAGPRPEALHRLLAMLAWLVRWRVIPTLAPIAPLMHIATNHIRWGEHRGGMFVAVDGTDQSGVAIRRSWHLIAEGDDGPLIPSMAVEAIVRNTLSDRAPPPGARAAVRELELDDYDKLFAGRAIVAGIRQDNASGALPLYARILGPAWHRLPAAIRAMHDITTAVTAEGRARVVRGRGVLARCVAALIGFPATASDLPVRVRFECAAGAESWTRTFGRDSFHSRQYAGLGHSEGLLCERFGPLTFAMALVATEDRLSLVLRRWSIFGVPLPLWLGPPSESYESAEGDRFNFHVKIRHPLTGLIVQYDGWLSPHVPRS